MGNKRFCFISLGNLYLCPYMEKYTSLIDSDYDVIYWNRHNIEESSGAKKMYSFNYEMNEGKGKVSKALGYMKFRKYAATIIKKNNYDGIILLQTSVGILLNWILRKRYKGRYIVDIRDYTMENNPIFYAMEKRLINSCAYAVISSRGFESFLPKFKYILVHNDVTIDETTISEFQSRRLNKDQIIISYIGLIRFHDQNKRVILKFKNDYRFKLRFIGKDSYALREFCEKNNIDNIELIDQFPPEKTLEYYYETNIINNLYGNNTPLLDYALSNKLYYAAKLVIPILVCPDTYMAEIIEKYGFGYVFDIEDENACDHLFDYYKSINQNELGVNCKDFNKKVCSENQEFVAMIKEFIKL